MILEKVYRHCRLDKVNQDRDQWWGLVNAVINLRFARNGASSTV